MSDKPAPSVISLRNLRKSFGLGDAEHYALDDVNLSIKQGEFIAIMGPSGCGKTTLLNVLGLLDDSTEGEYELDGISVATLSQRKKARIRSKHIGFIFQSFNLIPRLTVIDNVALPLLYRGGSKLSRLKKASAILRDFHLGEREYYFPYQLSGGQTQRVAIARALVNEPSIILADEPTGNLDSRTSHIIMEELSDLHHKGNTIIMVTHNPDLTTYASRVITMLDGKIDTDTQQRASAGATVGAPKTPEPTDKITPNSDPLSDNEPAAQEASSTPKKSPAERRLSLSDIVEEKDKEKKKEKAAKKPSKKTGSKTETKKEKRTAKKAARKLKKKKETA